MQDAALIAIGTGSNRARHDAAHAQPDHEAASFAVPREAPASTEASRVFVVDDDQAVRDALRDLLQDHGLAVELFADGEAFLGSMSAHRPGCLLLDEQMPGLSGVDLLERLAIDGHDVPAIIMSGCAAVPTVVRAMQAGALDFLEKPVSSEQLLASIRRALVQGRQRAATASTRKAAAQRFDHLTPRQHQILGLVLAGHPSKNIAVDLGISRRTVETHRAAIMRTTGSKSVATLAQHALSAEL